MSFLTASFVKGYNKKEHKMLKSPQGANVESFYLNLKIRDFNLL